LFTTLPAADGSWVEDDGGILSGGDVGGDAQLSDSWSRRYGRALVGGVEFCLLNFNAYWALDDDPTGWEPGQPRPVQVTVQVEHLHCTDPNRPGDTEFYSEYLYWDQHEGLDETAVEPEAPRRRIEGLTREDLAAAEEQIHCKEFWRKPGHDN
jgi:hypothetical protein